jgi:hypothetical protein
MSARQWHENFIGISDLNWNVRNLAWPGARDTTVA